MTSTKKAFVESKKLHLNILCVFFIVLLFTLSTSCTSKDKTIISNTASPQTSFSTKPTSETTKKAISSVAPASQIPATALSPKETPNKELDKKYDLAFSNHLSGNYKMSIQIANEIITIAPSYYKAYNIKGIALCFDGNFDKGLVLINKSLEMSPNYGYALFNKALAYELYGHYDEAILWYNKNLEVEEYSWSYYGIASVYGRRGDVDNTVLYLKKAIAIDSEVKKAAITEHDFDKVRNSKKFQALFYDTTSQNPDELLPILGYHAINNETYGIANLFVKQEDFEQQMKYLKDNNFTVITFDDIPNIKNIKKPIIITFDDGYEDNFTIAYPILKKYNFKATVFMMTDAIDKPNYLKSHQILQMKDLVNFQSHTITHTLLTELSLPDAERELLESKNQLQKLTGQNVNVIAYPVSKYNVSILEISKKNYKYGVIMNDKLFTSKGDFYAIDRFYIPRSLTFSSFKNYINVF